MLCCIRFLCISTAVKQSDWLSDNLFDAGISISSDVLSRIASDPFLLLWRALKIAGLRRFKCISHITVWICQKINESVVIYAHGKVIDKDIETIFKDEAFWLQVFDILGDSVFPLAVVLEQTFGEFERFPDAHTAVAEGADGVFEQTFLRAVVKERAVRIGEDKLDASESVVFTGELSKHRVAFFRSIRSCGL